MIARFVGAVGGGAVLPAQTSDDGQVTADWVARRSTILALRSSAAADKAAVALEAGATAGRHDQCVVSPGFGGAVSFPLAARPDISEKAASERKRQADRAYRQQRSSRIGAPPPKGGCVEENIVGGDQLRRKLASPTQPP